MNHKKRLQRARHKRRRCTACNRHLIFGPIIDAGYGATSRRIDHHKPRCRMWNSQYKAWCVPPLEGAPLFTIHRHFSEAG